jgi:hypothetical protein
MYIPSTAESRNIISNATLKLLEYGLCINVFFQVSVDGAPRRTYSVEIILIQRTAPIEAVVET